MATENKDKKQHKVVTGVLQKKEKDSGCHVVRDKAIDESRSHNIRKMQAPDEWPGPPNKKESEK